MERRQRQHPSSSPATLLFPLFLLFTTPAQAQRGLDDIEQLDGTEQALLDSGRIVIRRQTQVVSGGRLYGGTSWQRVKAPPSAVWSAVLDTPRYRELLPDVTEARLIQDEAGRRLVYLRHGHGFIGVQYHLVMNTVPAAHALWFYVDQSRSSSLREGRGFIVVRPYGDEQSVIAFTVYADIGGGVLSTILRPRIQDGLLRAPWTMKRYIEGSGRSRYLSPPEGD